MVSKKNDMTNSINIHLLSFILSTSLQNIKLYKVIIQQCILGFITYINLICVRILIQKKGNRAI